jgi:hypothetical protein
MQNFCLEAQAKPRFLDNKNNCPFQIGHFADRRRADAVNDHTTTRTPLRCLRCDRADREETDQQLSLLRPPALSMRKIDARDQTVYQVFVRRFPKSFRCYVAK